MIKTPIWTSGQNTITRNTKSLRLGGLNPIPELDVSLHGAVDLSKEQVRFETKRGIFLTGLK